MINYKHQSKKHIEAKAAYLEYLYAKKEEAARKEEADAAMLAKVYRDAGAAMARDGGAAAVKSTSAEKYTGAASAYAKGAAHGHASTTPKALGIPVIPFDMARSGTWGATPASVVSQVTAIASTQKTTSAGLGAWEDVPDPHAAGGNSFTTFRAAPLLAAPSTIPAAVGVNEPKERGVQLQRMLLKQAAGQDAAPSVLASLTAAQQDGEGDQEGTCPKRTLSDFNIQAKTLPVGGLSSDEDDELVVKFRSKRKSEASSGSPPGDVVKAEGPDGAEKHVTTTSLFKKRRR
jgi:hypothetical protein